MTAVSARSPARGGASPGGAPREASAEAAGGSRRRTLLVGVGAALLVAFVWEGVEVPRRDALARAAGAARRARPARSSVPLGVRERPEPAAHLEHRPDVLRAVAAQCRRERRAVPHRDRPVHVAGGGARVRVRGAPGTVPRHGLRPLAAARAGVRPVCRGQPDDPDRRPGADDRVRRRAIAWRPSSSSPPT